MPTRCVHGAVRIAEASERFVLRVDGRTPPKLGHHIKIAIRDAQRDTPLPSAEPVERLVPDHPHLGKRFRALFG